MANAKDVKRRKKLAAKAKLKAKNKVLPYEGTKYQADVWRPYVDAVDDAVFDVMGGSSRQLTDIAVRKSFEALARQLRGGLPPLPAADENSLPYTPDSEVDFLVQTIRQNWAKAFARFGSCQPADLIGVLRTLLNSINAHAWNTGATRGYVDFVWNRTQTLGGSSMSVGRILSSLPMSEFDFDSDDDFDDDSDDREQPALPAK